MKCWCFRLKLIPRLLICTLAFVLVIIGTNWIIKITGPWDGFLFRIPTLTKPKWESLRGKKMLDYVQPFRDTVIIQPQDLALNTTIGRASAIIFVLSRPESSVQRDAIRKTWYNWKDKCGVHILFFVGSDVTSSGSLQNQIQEESEQYRDIVMDSFEESYFALSTKVLRAMKYYLKIFITSPNLPLFIKADDDAFINLPNLMNYLELNGVSTSSNFIGGHRCNFGKVNRKSSSTMYLPHDMLEGYWLPSYLWGPTYAMSWDVVVKIYHRSMQMEFFPFEDVFLTGFVAHRELGIDLVHIPGMYEIQDITDNDLTHFLMVHPFKNPTQMVGFFSKLKNHASSRSDAFVFHIIINCLAPCVIATTLFSNILTIIR